MSVKVLPTDIVRRHVATLYDHRSESRRVRLSDVGTQYALPLLIAGLVVWRNVQIEGAAQILAGIAILDGFAFGLLVFVFQLRLSASVDPREASSDRLRLLNELFANVAYTTLVGLATAILLMIPLALTGETAGEALPLGWAAAATAFSTHFVLLLMMCVKRTDIAFQRYAR